MKMDPFSREYVGHSISIVKAANPLYLSIRGTVVDETRNMFRIRTETGDKNVPKRGNSFSIEFASERIDIDGRAILYTVEDRIHNASRIARLAKRMRH